MFTLIDLIPKTWPVFLAVAATLLCGVGILYGIASKMIYETSLHNGIKEQMRIVEELRKEKKNA